MANRTENPPLRFTLSEADNDAEREVLRQKLREHNAAALPAYFRPDEPVPRLNLYAHSLDDQLVGGLAAEIHWTALYIDYLWVDPALRGQGLGRWLVEWAEDRARQRGCAWATLTTFDFQARAFYEKLGYRVVGQLADYPPGHTCYWLRHDFER